MTAVRSTDVSSVLLAEMAAPTVTDQALIFSADPALITNIAKRVQSVDVFDYSYTALERLRTQIEAQKADNVRIHQSVFPAPDARYDIALMAAPKGRDFARAFLWSSFRSLEAGSKLYISGANNGGIKSVLADAEALFGRNVTLNTKLHHRMGVSVRSLADEEREFPSGWGHDPTVTVTREMKTPQGVFTLATMPGVFSWEHVDDGTRLLLEHAKIPAGATVLDVGCGHGIIGIVAAQTANHVMMVDDNLLAVRCAQESVQINGVENASVKAGDVYSSVDGKFDLILSNPPFHQDFDVTFSVAHRIIREAKQHLNAGGRLVIVANAFLSYEKLMAEHLSNIQILAKNSRYLVIEGQYS
jgi:16S rRNA (guanine1207-N2)-methyltransferase